MIKTIVLTSFFALSMSAHAANYKVDSATSKVTWKGSKRLGSFHNGNISVKEGQVEINDKGHLVNGNVVIDMTTLANEDLKADPENQKKLVGHLSSADFFDVSKYPTSSFKITSVKETKNKGEVIVKGNLTMIGKTHPAEAILKITNDKEAAKATGVIKIDRTLWGLKYGSGNIFKELTADKIISDEIELGLNIVAKR